MRTRQEEREHQEYRRDVSTNLCEESHLWFTRYFFKLRQGVKFRVNWHHVLISDTIDKIISGEIENAVINVAPGGTKTELVVINFIARGLALNPRSRFLHLSGSDILASLNSATAREIVKSEEYQKRWPFKVGLDADSKKRWNVLVDGYEAGGVYATSIGGQVTGFRAGRMVDGFQGAILIDDPIKPEDAYSRTKTDAVNRKFLTTVKSRRANPKTPIVLIMQRTAENDPTGFIKGGNMEGKWTHIEIPAVISREYVQEHFPEYAHLIDSTEEVDGRFSYWPYKERLEDLLKMEKGDGFDQSGARISRHVFSSQYQQAPKALGGNIIKGKDFVRYSFLPKLRYRKVFADTAQKTKERNDFSVFEEWGLGVDGKIYLLDLIRGRWEAPELQRRAVAFWAKCKHRKEWEWGTIAADHSFGQCRKLVVEDKSSGTGLIQTIKHPPYMIPLEAKERDKDKLTRCMDAVPSIEAGLVCVPENAPFTNDFISENESFTADDSHDFDDQLDPEFDAIDDMLQSGNKVRQWAAAGKKSEEEEPPQQVKSHIRRLLISAGRKGMIKNFGGDSLEPKKEPQKV